MATFSWSNTHALKSIDLKEQIAYTAPLITGSLLRYVAQYTKLNVPNSTGNTIRDILSILLTLL